MAATDTVVSGMVPICSHLARILVDSGSTHSFVSHLFVEHLNVRSAPLGYELSVALPLSKPIVMSTIYKNCEIRLGEKSMTIDLILLVVNHFDVILGMDWLSLNQATIDCERKEVNF